jgi:hypothetical protein
MQFKWKVWAQPVTIAVSYPFKSRGSKQITHVSYVFRNGEEYAIVTEEEKAVPVEKTGFNNKPMLWKWQCHVDNVHIFYMYSDLRFAFCVKP